MGNKIEELLELKMTRQRCYFLLHLWWLC